MSAIIKQNKTDWNLGYSDGLKNHKQSENCVADKLAYISGWIEGNARKGSPKTKN